MKRGKVNVDKDLSDTLAAMSEKERSVLADFLAVVAEPTTPAQPKPKVDPKPKSET